MSTITMQPEPDVWDREEVIRALNNGHTIFQVDGPMIAEAAYPSAVDPENQIVILSPESNQDELRVSVPAEKRWTHFPNGARFRMVLIAEEAP
jgi:hypothetical protein